MQRIHRWHKRLVKAADTGSPDLEDFAFAFFQNCHHLREWMEKTSKLEPEEVKQLFTRTPELRLCRDLCNGTKHLTLRKDTASVDANFSIGREYDPNSPSGYRLFVIADDKYDLLDLASRCVKIIDNFLTETPESDIRE